jgi:polysaccharide chain length determinant protein (PEP-CTERM system associated)
MNQKQRQLVNKYLDLFFRRKILILTLILLSLPIGLGVYLNTPKEYQSTCMLSYQRQGISPNKLSPDMESDTRVIVNTLSQIVESRTNLEQIITELDLYPGQRKVLPIEDVIELMRNKIEINLSKRGDVFTVSYSGGDPEKVVRVTNAIAAKFIEENLKYRQERATDTSSYTSQELQMAKKVMDDQDEAMRDYKLKNYNEMPGNREANMSRLASLQAQYQRKQDSIQELERTLVLIQDQINNRRMQLQGAAGNGDDGGELDIYQRLANLRSNLDTLLLRYTEKHPEIKRIRKLIEKMEEEIKTGAYATTNSSQMVQPSVTAALKNQPQVGVYDNILMQLEVRQKGVNLKIANVEKEKEQLLERIEQVEQWVAAAPIREAEWTALTREYGQLKKHYDFLVSQNLQAESMLNLEERQKGSQFRIEDPARNSGKPVKPDFLKIMGMSLLGGFGLGVVVTLFFNFFDSSFRDPETLEPLLGVPLLISIPYIETKVEHTKNTWKQVFTAGFFVVGCGLVVTLFVLVWQRGHIII